MTDEKDEDDYRPPFHWGDAGALVLAGGFSLFGLYLIGDMILGGHPLAILFQKPKEEPAAQRPLTQDEIRKIPFHAEPGEVVLSTNRPLPGMIKTFPEVENWSSLRITLRRLICTTSCPAYTVTISGDGAVVFQGDKCVAETGTHSARISHDAVAALVDRFRKADFFLLRTGYGAAKGPADMNEVEIGFDGHSNAVWTVGGARDGVPGVVGDLASAIDAAANTGQWIGSGAASCGQAAK